MRRRGHARTVVSAGSGSGGQSIEGLAAFDAASGWPFDFASMLVVHDLLRLIGLLLSPPRTIARMAPGFHGAYRSRWSSSRVRRAEHRPRPPQRHGLLVHTRSTGSQPARHGTHCSERSETRTPVAGRTSAGHWMRRSQPAMSPLRINGPQISRTSSRPAATMSPLPADGRHGRQ